MSQDDDDKKKFVKTNTAPVLKPPGLGQGGHAPRGAVGNKPQRQSDVVLGPLYLREGEKESGPYYVVDLDVDQIADGRRAPQTKAPEMQRDDGSIRFHETSDEAVNLFYATQKDHVMVPDPERQHERDEFLDSLYVKEQEAAERHGRDPELAALYDEKRGGMTPDMDQYYSRNAHEQGRGQEREPGTADAFNERARRKGPDR